MVAVLRFAQKQTFGNQSYAELLRRYHVAANPNAKDADDDYGSSESERDSKEKPVRGRVEAAAASVRRPMLGGRHRGSTLRARRPASSVSSETARWSAVMAARRFFLTSMARSRNPCYTLKRNSVTSPSTNS